ncbi:HD domain-containing protein [Thermoleophilia bacterium SCSIO 60948]|nr:HD domain-containing protein [Thermoleophilia bacterium SCSIO 60948]
MGATEVRDPVHGMVELSASEWQAVDSPDFQRLRSIRQLALTHLVYPGATHSRFEHSVGVAHVAGLLSDRLELSEEVRRSVRVAALLHDVGHGVFSHVSEQVIDDLSGVSGVHEAVSEFLIRNRPHFRSAFGSEACEAAADFVGLRGPRTVARDVVSGPCDADKLDYLLRDSYFAGVNYGKYDLDRVVGSARIIAPRSAQTQLGFEVSGIWALEELLLARHHMHRQVYRHKTRVSTDIMITRALRRAVELDVLPVGAFVVPEVNGAAQVDEDFVHLYLDQTDDAVIRKMADCADRIVSELTRSILHRRLLRQTASIHLDEREDKIGVAQIAAIRDPDEFDASKIAEVEAEVAAAVSVEPHLVAIDVDSRANPTYRNPSASLGPKDIMISHPDRGPTLLHQASEIFRNESGPDDHWLHLYAPDLSSEDRATAKDALWSLLKNL